MEHVLPQYISGSIEKSTNLPGLEQDLAGIVDETDPAEVDAEFLARSGGGKFTPALLEGSDSGSGEGTLDGEEKFSSPVFGSDS